MDHDETSEEFEIDLTVLSDDELAEFATLLREEYEEKKSVQELGADDLDELKQIAEVIVACKAEFSARMEQALLDEAVGDDSEFSAFSEFVKNKGVKAEAETAVEDDGEDTEEAGATDVVEATPIAKKDINVIISPKGIEGDVPAAATRGGQIVASADIRGYRAGQTLESLKDVAKAFQAKRPDVRGTDQGRDGATFLVASVQNEYPEERTLTMDLEANMAKISAITSPEAITASGGLCAPLQPLYEIKVFGDAHRPVRDALAQFKAERGGIRWMPSPTLTDLAGQSRVTTYTQDAAGYTNQDPAGTTDPKPSLHVTCPSEQTKKIDAYSKSLTFGNMSARTYPEQIEAWLKLGMSEFAKYTEIALLDAISAGSTAITAAQVYGVTFSLLEQLDITVTSFRSRHRSPNVKLRVLMPWWLRELIRTDIAAQTTGDGLGRYAISDGQIDDWFASRNVVVSWYQDNTTVAGAAFGAVSAGAIQTWPGTATWFVFPEGHWLFLDGGSLDLGLVRDSTLNSQNDYQIFYEEFFGLAGVGLESLQITSTLVANGSTAPLAAALRS